MSNAKDKDNKPGAYMQRAQALLHWSGTAKTAN
jgi:hypothetical protein